MQKANLDYNQSTLVGARGGREEGGRRASERRCNAACCMLLGDKDQMRNECRRRSLSAVCCMPPAARCRPSCMLRRYLHFAGGLWTRQDLWLQQRCTAAAISTHTWAPACVCEYVCGTSVICSKLLATHKLITEPSIAVICYDFAINLCTSLP